VRYETECGEDVSAPCDHSGAEGVGVGQTGVLQGDGGAVRRKAVPFASADYTLPLAVAITYAPELVDVLTSVPFRYMFAVTLPFSPLFWADM
jgi:hypothetical protein